MAVTDWIVGGQLVLLLLEFKVCQLYLTNFSNSCNDEPNPPGPPLFSVLREVSKMRVGIIDSDDAHCYCDQIKYFQQNSESMT